MKNQIELAGQALDLDQIRLHMVLEFGEAVPIGDAQAIVQMLASQNAYHPVADYLENVAQAYPDVDLSILDNLATRYFGSENELHNIYMKKVLISAVARINQPGCRVESVPILVNPRQGIGKSTFWRNLFGEDWFSDDMGDANEKDERMKLHNFWCLEWSEFENVYKKKDVSALKKFITTKTDSYRTPYSRTVKEYPRRSILVGTTNEQEILADPTGSRRFWVIPVKGIIPVEQLLKERDLLWAAAYALYKTGETWKLTSEQEQLGEELNKQFQVIDPWTEKIQEYIQHRDVITLNEIFRCLDIETARQDIGTTKRISAIFSRLGWETERKRENGSWIRQWVKKTEKFGFPSGSSGSSGSNLGINESVAKENQHQIDVSTETSVKPSYVVGKEPEKNTQFHLDQVDQSQQAFQPIDPDDPEEKPNFPENIVKQEFYVGQFAWALSLDKEIRITKIYPSAKKADVIIAGDPINKPRLLYSDLCPSKPKFLRGDEVEVLHGQHKAQTLMVDFAEKEQYWLRKSAKGFQTPIGPFDPEQLKLVKAR